MSYSIQRTQAIWHNRRAAGTYPRMPLPSALLRTGLLAGMLLLGQLCLASTEERQPSKDLSPQQVIRIVIDSLRDNDAAGDSGIATVFNFASPANKLSTGPLSRFTTMIKRGYPDMLNHSSSRYDPMEVDGDTAIQAVWLMTPVGTEIGYAFQLSRQAGGEFAGMWMTDMVIPLGEGPRSGTRI